MAVRPALLALSLLAPAAVHAQALVHPNQITGTVRFTNANPVIVGEIRTYAGSLTVTGSRTAPDLVAETREADAPWIQRPYELTVEAGDAGYAYDVDSKLEMRDGSLARSYKFLQATSAGVLLEPAPDVNLDVSECASMVEVAVPLGVRWASVTARRSGVQAQVSTPLPPPSLRLVLAGDGVTREVEVRIEIGTDPAVDTMIFERTFMVTCTCDVVTQLDCSGLGQPGTEGPGAIIGVADVLGADEHPSTTVHAMFGPFGNQRQVRIDSDPASGPYRLPNIVPSDICVPEEEYTVIATFRHGVPRRLQSTQVRIEDVFVAADTETDLGDAFVLDPGTLSGPIELLGPPLPLNPVPDGAWRHLTWTSDTFGTTWTPSATYVSAMDASAREGLGSSARAEFDGTVDPDGETFRGDSTLLLGAPYRAGGDWHAGLMRLAFSTDGSGLPPVQSMHQRETLRDRDVDAIRVEPGDMLTLARRHCFGMMTLGVIATWGTFHLPQVTLSGELVGQDAWGAIRDLTYTGEATGTPTTYAEGAADGQVILALPEGFHVIRTTVQAHDPSTGGVSTTEVLPVEARVACGQILNAVPGLVIGLDPVPACRESGLLRLHGSVNSGAPIATITAVTEGGTPVVACTDCGTSPSFEVELMAPGATIITVKALDALGQEASVATLTEEAFEPSALDLRPGSAPLTVRRDGAQVRLSFEGGVDATVFRGTLSSLRTGAYDHRSAACGVTGGADLVDAPAGSYFLVGASCDGATGSLGRDSLGGERPAPRASCD